MPEAYWIAGSEDADLPVLLRRAGVKSGQIHQTTWLGKAPAEFDPPGAFFGWAQAPLLDHTLLHAAGRMLLTGGAELLIIGEQVGEGWAAALLASSNAIGRHNLLPVARLTAFTTLPPGGGLSADWLIDSGCESSTPDLLAVDGVDNGLVFPAAPRLPLPHGYGSCAVLALHRLVATAPACGLLMSALPGSPALVTLLESI